MAYDTAINIPSGTNGTNGTNAAGSGIAYYLHNVSSDIPNSKIMNTTVFVTSPLSHANITNVANGDTLIMNWTTPSMNVTLIPAGVHTLHINVLKTSTGGNHVNYIYYKCWMMNSTGSILMFHGDSELSPVFLNGIPLDADLDLISPHLTTNLTDRMFIQVYVRQTGSGNLPDVSLMYDDLTDSRFILPSNAFTTQDIIDLVHNNTLPDNSKVNKSGDIITGEMNHSKNNLQLVSGISMNSSVSTTNITDDFSADNFTDVGLNIFVNTTAQYLYWKTYRSATDDRIYRNIGVLNDTNYVFNYTVHDTTNNGINGLFDFGLFSATANRNGYTGDAIFVTIDGANELVVNRYIDSGGGASAGTTLAITAGDTLYVSTQRLSNTSIKTYVFNNSAKTIQITGSPVTTTIPATVINLQYIQASNYNDGANPTQYTEGWIDDVFLYSSGAPEKIFCVKVSSSGVLYTTLGYC